MLPLFLSDGKSRAPVAVLEGPEPNSPAGEAPGVAHTQHAGICPSHQLGEWRGPRRPAMDLVPWTSHVPPRAWAAQYCLGSDRARRRRHRRQRRCRLGQPPRLGWQAAAVKAPRVALFASLPAEVRDRSVVPTGVVPRRAVARAATALATRLPILRPARRACRCRRGPSWGESGRRRGGRGGRCGGDSGS